MTNSRRTDSEEYATGILVKQARRVESNHPDKHPISILIAAAAILRLGGFVDPKDGHIIHAADRLLESLEPLPTPAADVELRKLDPKKRRQLEAIRPAWDNTIQILESLLPDATVAMWIKPVEICGADDGFLLLSAPTNVRTWVERRYGQMITNAFSESLDGDRQVKGVKFVEWKPEPAPDMPASENKEQP